MTVRDPLSERSRSLVRRSSPFYPKRLLYLGGDFTKANGAPSDKLSFHNGIEWLPLNNIPDISNVLDFHTHPGKRILYSFGNNNTSSRPAGYRYTNGKMLSILGKANILISGVQATSITYKNELYCGAAALVLGTLHHLAVFKDPAIGWESAGRPNNGIRASVEFSGNLIVGGVFTTIDGTSFKRVAQFDGTNFSTLGTGFNNGAVLGLVVHANELYACGTFTLNGDNDSVNRIAKWDGISKWIALDTGLNALGITIETFDGNLVVGGDFTTAGGVSATRIAQWNGSAWAALGSGVDDRPRDLHVHDDGDLYVCGEFDNAGGLSSPKVAKWDGVTWTALGFAAGAGEAAFALETF